MSQNKRTYNFVLVLSGVSEPDARVEDALYGSECNDALLSFRAGIAYLDFDREARSFEQAVLSAIRDVESADERLRVVSVEPGDSVTASEIARRAGVTREYIRLLVEGERGPGSFPTPRSGMTSKTLLWSWAEVARWLLAHEVIDDENDENDENIVETAAILRDFNDALELRADGGAKARRLKYLQELKAIKAGAGGALHRSG